ncbi:hypothetical protein [Marinicrinis lubricantis]|uniref:Uncharacterized protein n=1 Tax=Marinicrinis lubricantis TaxID=2086470 RepID=A0ABW1IJS4_9BACL
MQEEWKHALYYIQSELQRMETMAGTLSTIEQEHHRKLTNYEQGDLLDIAVEEQSAARQLGMMKQMCTTMAQQLEALQKQADRSFQVESNGNAKVH